MTVPAQNDNQPVDKSNEKELNFRAMEARYQRQLDQERQARLQAEERAASYEKAKQAPAEQEEEEDDQPYVDKKSLNKVLSKFSQNMDQKIDKRAEEKARVMVEQERQINYLKRNPDFNQVLAPEIIQKFAEKYPEVAEDMLEMPDGFARQKLLYQNIKALGVHKKDEPKADIQAAIDKNKRNPFYQPSTMNTPAYQGQQGDFSESGQKAAYEKMQAMIKGRRY